MMELNTGLGTMMNNWSGNKSVFLSDLDHIV